jgi:hypothetical protein
MGGRQQGLTALHCSRLGDPLDCLAHLRGVANMGGSADTNIDEAGVEACNRDGSRIFCSPPLLSTIANN